MAKTTIGALNVKLSANTAAFSRGMKRAKKQSFSFTKAIKRSAVAIGALATASAAAAVFGLQRLARAQMDVIDSAGKLSDITGTTTESIAAFRLAAKLAGSSTSGADKALKNFVRRIGEAKTGTGEAIRGLEMLNLSADRLADMDAVDAFAAVSAEIKKLPTAADRASAAYFLLGRAGSELGNLILGGAEAIKFAKQVTLAFGTAVSGMSAKQIEAANDSLTIMSEVYKGIGATIAVQVAPFVIAIAKRFTDAAASGESFGAKTTRAFNKVVGVIWLFVDGLQTVGQVFGRVQRFILSGLAKSIEMAGMLIGVLNKIDPTSATDRMMELQKSAADMIASMRSNAQAAESFFGGKAFSVRIRKAMKGIRKDAEKIADAMIQSAKAGGDFGAEIERVADAAESANVEAGGGGGGGVGSDAFRQVSLARTAVAGRTRMDELLAQIARHTAVTANNSRMMGVN